MRWGDVNRPVVYPHWRSIFSTMAAVDPLPLVPAMWMTLSLCSSLSSPRRCDNGRCESGTDQMHCG